MNKNQNKDHFYEMDSTVTPAIFDTGSNVILTPLRLLNEFKQKYFKSYLDDETCTVLEDSSTSFGFRCESSLDYEVFPSLHFVFDNDISYEIKAKYLFIDDSYGKLFRMVFTKTPANGWLLGQPFLKQYHMVFDLEDNTIGFYHNNKNSEIVQSNEISLKEYTYVTEESNIESKENSNILYICLFCGVALILLLSFFIIRGVLKNKKNIK